MNAKIDIKTNLAIQRISSRLPAKNNENKEIKVTFQEIYTIILFLKRHYKKVFNKLAKISTLCYLVFPN